MASAFNDVKRRPTMSDVAAAAGVSLKTVSRVVNDEPCVRSETAALVHDAIARLGFSRTLIPNSFEQRTDRPASVRLRRPSLRATARLTVSFSVPRPAETHVARTRNPRVSVPTRSRRSTFVSATNGGRGLEPCGAPTTNARSRRFSRLPARSRERYSTRWPPSALTLTAPA